MPADRAPSGPQTPQRKREPKRWVIRIVFPDGGVAWLRHGSVVGSGSIVRFTNLQTAEVNLDFVRQGLDEGAVASVVPVTASKAWK